MEIKFIDIHKAILHYLELDSNTDLEVIGSWYFLFLNSDKDKMSLQLPFFTNELAQLSFNYIRAFTIVFYLRNNENSIDLTNKCLFNIFFKNNQLDHENLFLEFRGSKDNLAKWGNDTITKLNNFLPVFNTKKLSEFNDLNSFRNSFDLYRVIKLNNIINNPVLIDLEVNTLLFNNLGINISQMISEKVLQLNRNLNRKDAISTYNQLSNEINNSITFKFPYSIKPTYPLTEIGKKKFKLIFKNRFSYSEIQKDEIILLKNEKSLSNQVNFKIIYTNHSKELYHLFKEFREKWIHLDLNKYTSPFPKYWFLFLNPSLSKGEWLTQFMLDFPAVANNPIIKDVEKIIQEVFGLNWISEQLNSSTKLYFPELFSFRKKRLHFVFENFKNYIKSLNPNVEFLENLNTNNFKDVIVLDAFNIISLANMNQIAKNHTINIILPDFLYFGYQPWIKYHLHEYQFKPLLEGLRSDLDENYSTNSEEISKTKKAVIKEITSQIKKYTEKYDLNEIDEINSNDSFPNLDDIEFSNDEEIDLIESVSSKSVKPSKYVIINQNLFDETIMPAKEGVLVQKDTLLYINADLLLKGDYYIRNNDLLLLLKKNELYDNLVNIPDIVLRFQNDLFKIDKVYEKLKHKGISYQHKAYFEKTYIVKEYNKQLFRIPRRKKDWIIICEFLNSCNTSQKISHSIQSLAFVAYYGRGSLNVLKEMYKKIITLLLENEWIGSLDNPKVLFEITSVIHNYKHIFDTKNKFESIDIAESIITTILHQINFREVKTININSNE